MADFCQTCSLASFGTDFQELAKLMPPEKYDAEHGALALCECCGPVVVDYNGKRMTEDCLTSCTCADALKHVLYKTGDPDVPEPITDRNGEVVLDLCRKCGRGEAELSEPCIQREPTDGRLVSEQS